MERDGWDPETQQFIDFNDDDDDELKLKPKHTHIDQSSLKESVELAEKRKPEIHEQEEEPVKSPQKNQENAISASNENTEQTMFVKVKMSSNEQLFTYAFCKLFENMPEVSYEQIDQLSLPFFRSKDERAIKNKPNVLIANQCMVRKQSDKKWFEILPEGIQRFKTENSHLEEILEKEISKDFLDALTP